MSDFIDSCERIKSVSIEDPPAQRQGMRNEYCAPDRAPQGQAGGRGNGDRMNALHTPGPWMFDCEAGRVCGFVAEEREDGRGLADVRASQRIKHADKRRSDEFVMSEEDVANARLMASAPTLLERLRDALAVLETLDYEQHENLAELEARTRAAIALATGEDAGRPTRTYTVELRKSVCVTVDGTSIADAKAQAKALPGDLDGAWFKAEPEVVGVEPYA